MKIWWWLNANAPALQALGGLLSFSVALVTVPLLIRTMRVAREAAEAAKEQAQASKAQVEAAKESSRVSELQLVAAQESAAAEREHSMIIRQQTLASLRPVLIFAKRSGNMVLYTVVENQTEAIALDIQAWSGTPESPGKPIELGQEIIAGRAETGASGFDLGQAERSAMGSVFHNDVAPAFLRYRSQDGRVFITQLENLNARPWNHKIFEVPR